jgi:hypothetical protein
MRFEIVQQFDPNGETIEDPPDIWFQKANEHRLTPKEKRWYLATDNKSLEETEDPSNEDPDFYFVNINSYGGSEEENYIVLLLHCFLPKEFGEPVSIRE